MLSSVSKESVVNFEGTLNITDEWYSRVVSLGREFTFSPDRSLLEVESGVSTFVGYKINTNVKYKIVDVLYFCFLDGDCCFYVRLLNFY